MAVDPKQPSPAPPQRRLGRWIRSFAIGLAAIPSVLLVLVVGTLLAFDSDWGRERVRHIVEQKTSKALVGELRIGHIARLGLRAIVIEDVSVTLDGKPLARVQRMALYPSLSALLRGELVVREVSIGGPEVWLERCDDVLCLQKALAPTDPQPDTGQASDPPRLRVQRLALERGAIHGLPQDISITAFEVEASLAMQPALAIQIGKLELEARRSEVTLARIETFAADINLKPGSKWTVQLGGRLGDEACSLDATMGWEQEGPGAFQAQLALGVAPDDLRRLGLEEAAEQLSTPLRLQVSAQGNLAQGDLERLNAEGRLYTAGGEVALQVSHRTGHWQAQLSTQGVELATVTSAADFRFAGSLALDVQPTTTPEHHRIELSLENVSVDAMLLPKLRLQGVLEPQALQIERLEAAELRDRGGELHLSGRIGFDQHVDLDLRIKLPHVQREPLLAPLLPRDIQIAHLALNAQAQGSLTAPKLNARIQGRGLRVQQVQLATLSMTVDGGPQRYRLQGRMQPQGEPEPVVLRARASLHQSGRAHAEATLEGIELRTLEMWGLLPFPLEGRVALRANLDGDLAAPVAALELDLHGLRHDRQLLGDLKLQASLNRPKQRAEATLRGDLVGGSQLDVHTLVALAARPDWAEAFRAASLEADLRLQALDLGALAPLLAAHAPDTEALEGHFDLELSARGSLLAPAIQFALRGRHLAQRQSLDTSLDLDIDGHINAENFEARLALRQPMETEDAADRPDLPQQNLATLSTAAALGINRLRENFTLADLNTIVWSMLLEIPEQRLDQWPVPLGLEFPVQAQLKVDLHNQGQGLAGHITAESTLDIAALTKHLSNSTNDTSQATDTRALLGAAPDCPQLPTAQADLDIALQDGLSKLVFRGRLGDHDVLNAEVTAKTPLTAWLEAGVAPALPAIDAQAHLNALMLEHVPGICQRGQGTLNASVHAADLFGGHTKLEVNASGQGLRFGDHPALDLDVSAQGDRRHAEGTLLLSQGERSPLRLRFEAPLHWPLSTSVPSLADDQAWNAEAIFEQTPLALVAAAGPWIAQPRGHFEGALRVRGRGTEDIDFDGNLALQRLSFTLTDPVQRFEQLEGNLRFDREGVSIERLRMHDGRGSLQVDGSLRLAGFVPDHLQLGIAASAMPIRSEGVIFGTLDTRAEVDAQLNASPRQVQVVLREMALGLPSRSGRNLQQLDAHPRVVYESALAPDETPTRQTSPVVEESPAGVPLQVDIDAGRPFWVRHQDFALQLSSRLQIQQQGDDTRLSGSIRVQRGHLNLLGKAFDFQRGSIEFDGGNETNPILDLAAIHRMRSGDTVTVHIAGRLLRPELSFSSSMPDVTTDTEVMALLVRGRAGDNTATAQEQTANMLSGLTAGLLSNLTRREVGAIVPVLSIESRGSGDTRVRAGIQADQFIPRFLSTWVEGAYVEGFLGTASDAARGNTGFVIELYFPRDFMSTGTFEEPNNWSLDLTWEP